jgi:hypothetical protein
LILAMLHHRQGDPAAARVCYDQVIAWWREQPNPPEAIRSEHESLLEEATRLIDGEAASARKSLRPARGASE